VASRSGDAALSEWLHQLVKQSADPDERRAAAFALGALQPEAEPELSLLDGNAEVAEAFLAGFRHPGSAQLVERLAPGPGAARPPALKLQHAAAQARGGPLAAELRRMSGPDADAAVQPIQALLLARRILDGESTGPEARDPGLLALPGGAWVLAAARARPEGQALPAGEGADAAALQKALRGELSVKAMAAIVDQKLLAAAVTPEGYRQKLLRELRVDLLCGGSAFALQKRGVSLPPSEVPYLPKGPPESNTAYFRVLITLLQRL
jgi:hypothetical protein